MTLDADGYSELLHMFQIQGLGWQMPGDGNLQNSKDHGEPSCTEGSTTYILA